MPRRHAISLFARPSAIIANTSVSRAVSVAELRGRAGESICAGGKMPRPAATARKAIPICSPVASGSSTPLAPARIISSAAPDVSSTTLWLLSARSATAASSSGDSCQRMTSGLRSSAASWSSAALTAPATAISGRPSSRALIPALVTGCDVATKTRSKTGSLFARRSFHRREDHFHRHAAPQNTRGQRIADRFRLEVGLDSIGLGNRLAAERQQEVADYNAGFCRRPLGLDGKNHQTCLSVRESYGMHADADETPPDPSFDKQFLHYARNGCRRQRHPRAARESGSIQPDHLALHIDQRSARETGVNTDIGTDKSIDATTAPRSPCAAERTDDAEAGANPVQSPASQREH